jgi:hypothetical protein
MREILITFSNNETVILPTYSMVQEVIKAYTLKNFLIAGFRCSSASDFKRLQSEIGELQSTYRGK